MSDLPPLGFRFYPTEEELVGFYLRHKLEGTREEKLERVIPVLDIFNGLDPFQLPGLSGQVCQGDTEQWFFFCPRQEREAQGGRPNRITPSGYWKATGSPCPVYSSNDRAIGLKKTMVFYEGRAPTGTKTEWKVNEYRALEAPGAAGMSPRLRNEFSLCRIYIKSGCLRSFDRRPLPTSDSRLTSVGRRSSERREGVQPAGGSSQGEASSSVSTSLIARSSSRDSSSSGDLVPHTSVEDATEGWHMMEGMEELLDTLSWD